MHMFVIIKLAYDAALFCPRIGISDVFITAKKRPIDNHHTGNDDTTHRKRSTCRRLPPANILVLNCVDGETKAETEDRFPLRPFVPTDGNCWDGVDFSNIYDILSKTYGESRSGRVRIQMARCRSNSIFAEVLKRIFNCTNNAKLLDTHQLHKSRSSWCTYCDKLSLQQYLYDFV